MALERRLADFSGSLGPVDARTHRTFGFDVPGGCRALRLRFDYRPKRPTEQHSAALIRAALEARAQALAARLGSTQAHLAQAWAEAQQQRLLGPSATPGPYGRTPNLLTLSLDDAQGAYRGAAHRHDPAQELWLAPETASPGFVAGPLPAGRWTVTLTVHGLHTASCRYRIQIGAVTA